MPYLIDGANLGGALGGARGARNCEAILAALLPWARDRKQVVVVFDGPDRPEMATRLGGVEIVWSGKRSADDWIVARVEAAGKSAKSWTVVTEDRDLARRCRDQGARVERASNFVRRTMKPSTVSTKAGRVPAASDKPAPTAQEIVHWREIFGGDNKGR